MAPTEAASKSSHVARTRRHLEADLQLDRLIELTYGHAAPGSNALALVLRIIDPSPPARWDQLALTGLSTQVLLRLADRAADRFRSLPAWSATELDALLEALTLEARVQARALRQALSIFALRSITPLPLPEVLELIGHEESLRRLLEGKRAFQACQLIG